MSTYPGVYIAEKSGLSLGSAGMSGLVPLLVGRFFRKNGAEVTLSDGLTYISNWTEFADNFLSAPMKVTLKKDGTIASSSFESDAEDTGGSKAKKSAKTPKASAQSVKSSADEEITNEGITPAAQLALTIDNLNTGVLALTSYFNNGGSACYLLSLGSSDNATDIGAQIQEYSELSLLAAIDCDAAKLNAVNSSLDTFVGSNKQSFLLASLQDNQDFTNGTNVAVYTPTLSLASSPALYDEGILITDIDVPKSMAELQIGTVEERKIYQDVKKALADNGISYGEGVLNPVISPVAAVAGAYCATERTRGIWKAPANISLVGVSPTEAISKEQHGELNSTGTNAIIWQSRSGTTIMGARTREDPAKTTWRYVPVRMLFNTVGRDIRNMLSPVVFEPNSAPTWQSVTAAINNYLYLLWKKGGLYGNTPEQAYRVSLALEGSDIDSGILRVRVGMAALRPVEFIYLEFTQDMPISA